MNRFVKFIVNGTLLLLLCTACLPQKPEINKTKTIRVSTETDPHTFDPRLVRDLSDTTFIQTFYEGLMRSEGDAEPAPALAESFTLSPDKKTYTFHLRQSEWSNGDPVTAHDFADSWKSMLDPALPAPNAYQLYVIKGAKEAKEGKASLDLIGIQALDDKTLAVELEQPTPYFLNLTATYFLYPAHQSTRNNQKGTEAAPVTNGPYQLDPSQQFSNEWTAIPNPYYWDRQAVKLDAIKIVKLDNSTALKLFDQQELEWAGSPMSTIPMDMMAALKQNTNLKNTPAAGVYFLRVNIENPPFDQPKMRRAFALALNRSDLVEHVLQGNQQPAHRYLPPFFASGPLYKDHDLEVAQSLFNEALAEKNLTSSTLPTISLCYASNPRAYKTAQVLQQEWKEAFGIDIQLQGCESKILFDRLKNHDYQIAFGSWFADILDPISFLDVFKHKNNGTNNTQWENPRYIELLDSSTRANNAQDRQQLLTQAEELLIEEMPIIPLFFNSYNYLQNPNLKGVYFSELGYLDFKRAYLEK